jgi:hypothetical protein
MLDCDWSSDVCSSDLVYPDGAPTFWHLLCGQIDRVTVRVQQRPIPPEVLGCDPVADRACRQRITEWVELQWREKDLLVDSLMQGR